MILSKQEKESISAFYYTKGYKEFDESLYSGFNEDVPLDIFNKVCENLNIKYQDYKEYFHYFRKMFNKGWCKANLHHFREKTFEDYSEKRILNPSRKIKNPVRKISVEEYMRDKQL